MHVLLVDDHAIFRQGMTFLLTDLDEQLQFTEAGTCEEALAELNEKSADLVLLDLNMPGSSGLNALHEIREGFPSVPLAVLSGVDDPTLIRDAIDAGASGFVPKSSTSEVLVAALRLILAGGVYLPRAALNRPPVAPPPQEQTPESVRAMFSERQYDVLMLAIQGKPNKVIARELDIAEGTVKTHLSAAFRVLGVRNRTEAVFTAAQLGLTPQPRDPH